MSGSTCRWPNHIAYCTHRSPSCTRLLLPGVRDAWSSRCDVDVRRAGHFLSGRNVSDNDPDRNGLDRSALETEPVAYFTPAAAIRREWTLGHRSVGKGHGAGQQLVSHL